MQNPEKHFTCQARPLSLRGQRFTVRGGGGLRMRRRINTGGFPMKRILLFIAGCCLVIQAALVTLSICGHAENAVFLLPLVCLSGWGGYKPIRMAIANQKTPANQPIVETQDKSPR